MNNAPKWFWANSRILSKSSRLAWQALGYAGGSISDLVVTHVFHQSTETEPRSGRARITGQACKRTGTLTVVSERAQHKIVATRKPRDERPRPRPGRFQEDESAGERHSAAPYGAVDSGVEMQGSGCQDMAVRVQDLCEFSRLNCPPAISSHDSASFPPQPQVENHLSEAQASFVGLDCWGIPLFPSHVAYDLGRIRGHEPRACYG